MNMFLLCVGRFNTGHHYMIIGADFNWTESDGIEALSLLERTMHSPMESTLECVRMSAIDLHKRQVIYCCQSSSLA
jgi:hypothetical protein